MKTEIICIIDKSGSMDSIKNDAIGGFNAFLEEQQKLTDDTKMSIVLFDSNHKMLQESVSLNEVVKLDATNYIPGSMTALYDAIGFSIENTIEKIKNKPDGEKPERVLVIILTDGEENRSREYTKDAIFNMIEEQRKQDWEFIFLAANQDAMKSAGAIAIPTANSVHFAATADGVNDVYSKISNATFAYRSSSMKSSAKLFDDLNIDININTKKNKENSK